MSMILVGDTAKVIRSPYSDVKNGTIAVVKEIKFIHFGKNWAVYILDGLPNRAFRIYELEKADLISPCLIGNSSI